MCQFTAESLKKYKAHNFTTLNRVCKSQCLKTKYLNQVKSWEFLIQKVDKNIYF